MLVMLVSTLPFLFFNANFILFDLFLVGFIFLVMLSSHSSVYSLDFSDVLSSSMVLMTCYFYGVLLLLLFKYKDSRGAQYKISLFFLFSSLVYCFLFKSLWWFYVFFEVGLVPLLLIIYSFGYQVERVQASFYLFFYTMMGSFPLLVLFFIFTRKFSFSFFLFPFSNWFSSVVISVLFFLVFFIKLPVYFFHLWLPKAHVEAPVSGSMILAAVLLKLGGYGIFRGIFLFTWFPVIPLLAVVLWGSVLSALICVIQSDLKALVAYSSVSHMGVMVAALFLNSFFSLKAFLVIMLGHAFCSSALFFLVNFFYERTLSRQTFVSRGSSAGLFFLVLMLFVFFAINFSVPPSFNLLAEIFLFTVSWGFDSVILFLMGAVSFLVAFYCIYAYSNSAQGKAWKVKGFNILFDLYFVVLGFHFLPSFLLIFLLPLF